MVDTSHSSTRRVAVVGAGIVGLCLTEALTRRGESVRCFERGFAGAGQSGGVTRVFRHRHSNPDLVELALEAQVSWRGLEERTGEELLGKEGVVILDSDGEEEAARLRALGVAIDTPSWTTTRSRMPIAPAPDEDQVQPVLEAHGGAIRARKAISGLSALVGGSIASAEVEGIAQDERGVTVFASDGIYEAEEAFVTAGDGTAALARAGGVEIPERRAHHLRLTFECLHPETLPCLLDKSNSFGEIAYGSPTPDGAGYAIGISGDGGTVPAPSSTGPDPARLLEIQRRTEAYARRLLPTALGEVTGARLCLATPLESGDDDFRAWRQGRITYFAGHNLFKFAPLLGSLLAESAGGRDLPRALRLEP